MYNDNENDIPFIYKQNAFFFECNNDEEFVLDNIIYREINFEPKLIIYKTQSFNLDNSNTEVKLRRFKTF